MKIKLVELVENASNIDMASQTRTLLAETHELELLDSGWLRWRTKRASGDPATGEEVKYVYGDWHQSPPSLIRNVREEAELQNVGTSLEVQTKSNAVSDAERELSPKRRGRPPKTA